MRNKIKIFLRDLLPSRFQVPLKYCVNALRGQQEAELRLLNLLVTPDRLAIDVGGNRGAYAYRLSQLGCRVEVFEPNPACSTVLSAWANDKKRVTVHNVGLSNEHTSATLHIPLDRFGVEHDASASLEHSDFDLSRSQVVELRTLDSYNFDNVGFIKIDVEGHEFNVLLGSIKTISLFKPTILIEIEQRHIQKPIDEIIKFIENLGYDGFFYQNENLVSLEKFIAVRDQKFENFSSDDQPYINNFFFFHQDNLAAGQYASFFDRKR